MARRNNVFDHFLEFKSQVTETENPEGVLLEDSINVIPKGQAIRTRKGTTHIASVPGSTRHVLTQQTVGTTANPVSIHRDTGQIINLGSGSPGVINNTGDTPYVNSDNHAIVYGPDTYILSSPMEVVYGGESIVTKPDETTHSRYGRIHDAGDQIIPNWAGLHDQHLIAAMQTNPFAGGAWDTVHFPATSGDAGYISARRYLELRIQLDDPSIVLILGSGGTGGIAAYGNGEYGIEAHDSAERGLGFLEDFRVWLDFIHTIYNLPTTARDLTGGYALHYSAPPNNGSYITGLYPGWIRTRLLVSGQYEVEREVSTNQSFIVDIGETDSIVAETYNLWSRAGNGSVLGVSNGPGGSLRWYKNASSGVGAISNWVLEPASTTTNKAIRNVAKLNGNTLDWAANGNVVWAIGIAQPDPAWNNEVILQAGVFAGRGFIVTRKGISFSKAGDPTVWFPEYDPNAPGVLLASDAFHIDINIDISAINPVVIMENSMIVQGFETVRIDAGASFSPTGYSLSPLAIDTLSNIVATGSKLYWLQRKGNTAQLVVASQSITNINLVYQTIDAVELPIQTYELFVDTSGTVRLLNGTTTYWVLDYMDDQGLTPVFSKRQYPVVHTLGGLENVLGVTYSASDATLTGVNATLNNFNSLFTADNQQTGSYTAQPAGDTNEFISVRHDTGLIAKGELPLNVTVTWGLRYPAHASIHHIGPASAGRAAAHVHKTHLTDVTMDMAENGGLFLELKTAKTSHLWAWENQFDNGIESKTIPVRFREHNHQIVARVNRPMKQHDQLNIKSLDGKSWHIARMNVRGRAG